MRDSCKVLNHMRKIQVTSLSEQGSSHVIFGLRAIPISQLFPHLPSRQHVWAHTPPREEHRLLWWVKYQHGVCPSPPPSLSSAFSSSQLGWTESRSPISNPPPHQHLYTFFLLFQQAISKQNYLQYCQGSQQTTPIFGIIQIVFFLFPSIACRIDWFMGFYFTKYHLNQMPKSSLYTTLYSL